MKDIGINTRWLNPYLGLMRFLPDITIVRIHKSRMSDEAIMVSITYGFIRAVHMN